MLLGAQEAAAEELEEAYSAEVWHPVRGRLSQPKPGVKAARVDLQTMAYEAKARPLPELADSWSSGRAGDGHNVHWRSSTRALDVPLASGRAELPCVFQSTGASLASTERAGLCWHADSSSWHGMRARRVCTCWQGWAVAEGVPGLIRACMRCSSAPRRCTSAATT